MAIPTFVYVFVTLYLILRLFRWGFQKTWGSIDRKNEVSCQGKIVLITGANAGIGRATAYEFATRHANVIMACRDLKKAKEAVEWIREKTGSGQLICMELDLSNLKSVKKFAEEFKAKYDRLDILVNNAGLMLQPGDYQKTKDGLEIHFGVNHVGHFLLTNLLLEPLKKAAPSRIVTVSSMAHNWAKLDLKDLNSEKSKIEKAVMIHPLYSNSKLANVLFNHELSKRLHGTGVRTYVLCPGGVQTEIGRNFGGAIALIMNVTLQPLLKAFVLKTAEEGAATTMYCALSKNLINETGQMYQNCGLWQAKDRVPIKDEDAKRLWTESEKIVGDYL